MWEENIGYYMQNRAGTYLCKVNNGNNRAICEILFKVNNKDTRTTSISLPPENVRKFLVFWHFQGVEK